MDFTKKNGAVPSQKIKEMIKENYIKNADAKNVQPASLDLTISNEAYQMKGSFLPQIGEKIRDIVDNGFALKIDLENPLEQNKIYWIKLQEELNLPKGIFALSSNKSSTGRINIQARLLADGVPRFDRVHSRYCENSNSYRGSLWIEIIPRSFPIKLTAGDKLNQLRFFNNCSRLSIRELKNTYSKHQLLFEKSGNFIQGKEVKIRDDDATLILSVDLSSRNFNKLKSRQPFALRAKELDQIGIEPRQSSSFSKKGCPKGDSVRAKQAPIWSNSGKTIGYKAISSDKILEFQKQNYYSSEDFFEPIFAPKDGHLILKKNEFYLFSTKEFIRVPSSLAAEMIAYDISNGEFRSHYAGFFDPGFGYGKSGEIKGTPAVLEVRAFDNNFILRDGQPICKMVYDKLSDQPDLIYGEKNLGSHYAFQRGPKLSKHFKI